MAEGILALYHSSHRLQAKAGPSLSVLRHLFSICTTIYCESYMLGMRAMRKRTHPGRRGRTQHAVVQRGGTVPCDLRSQKNEADVKEAYNQVGHQVKR